MTIPRHLARARQAWSPIIPARTRLFHPPHSLGQALLGLPGCSHWSQPQCWRRHFSDTKHTPQPATGAKAHPAASSSSIEDELFDFVEEDESEEDFDSDDYGVIVDSVEGSDSETSVHIPPERPTLPRSIKKLNKLLGRHVPLVIPEHELDETFVRGRGPGGQAINKTSSCVSLIHLPTGIRVLAQPTRLREQNRTAARHIMREKLDALRVQGLYTPSNYSPPEIKLGANDSDNPKQARKAERKALEVVTATSYTKEEIRAAKERSRQADRAKKHRRKKRKMEEEAEAKENRGNLKAVVSSGSA